jgi:hypothetical protein
MFKDPVAVANYSCQAKSASQPKAAFSFEGGSGTLGVLRQGTYQKKTCTKTYAAGTRKHTLPGFPSLLSPLLGPSYGHAPAWVFSSLLERHKGGVLNDSQGKATTFYSRGVAETLLMNTHARTHKHKHDTKRY